MKILILRAVLWVAIAVLSYLIIDLIYQDLKFEKMKTAKETARCERLEKAREVQFVYRDEYRKFAKNWDDLTTFAKTGKITLVKTTGDPNDTTIQVVRDTSYVSVLDSLFSGNIASIDSLSHIPFSKENKMFKLEANKINLRNVMVDVFQITDTDPIFQDPEQTESDGDPKSEPLQIGSMYQANYDFNRDPRRKK